MSFAFVRFLDMNSIIHVTELGAGLALCFLLVLLLGLLVCFIVLSGL